jgi:hypothetical protein
VQSRHSLSSFTVVPRDLHTDFRPPFIFTSYSRSFLLSAIIMSFTENSQDLHSFNTALHPTHYKTILPNLSYPSRLDLHIPWSGPSAPLLFSVRLCFFSSCSLTFGPQKTTRPEMTTIATNIPNFQVSYPNSDSLKR